MILTEIEYFKDTLSVVSMVIYNAAVTLNSVAVVQFFNHVCKVFFEDLIQSDTDQIKILEQVANHYNVIELNSQRMLYLHVLI